MDIQDYKRMGLFEGAGKTMRKLWILLAVMLISSCANYNYSGWEDTGNTIKLSVNRSVVINNLSVSITNISIGNFTILQFNSTCVGFRFNTTGAAILSCMP